jgi:hypothetical protein
VIWNDKNTHGGQLVASQTTFGDFKDLSVIATFAGEQFALVSLLDGSSFVRPCNKEILVERLNKHHFAPIAKVLGSVDMPENRAGLPAVQITGLRKQP